MLRIAVISGPGFKCRRRLRKRNPLDFTKALSVNFPELLEHSGSETCKGVSAKIVAVVGCSSPGHCIQVISLISPRFPAWLVRGGLRAGWASAHKMEVAEWPEFPGGESVRPLRYNFISARWQMLAIGSASLGSRRTSGGWGSGPSGRTLIASVNPGR